MMMIRCRLIFAHTPFYYGPLAFHLPFYLPCHLPFHPFGFSKPREPSSSSSSHCRIAEPRGRWPLRQPFQTTGNFPGGPIFQQTWRGNIGNYIRQPTLTRFRRKFRRIFRLRYGSKQPDFPTSYYWTGSGVSEWMSKWTNERSGAREQCKQCGVSEWVSDVSEWTNGRASGPILTSC